MKREKKRFAIGCTIEPKTFFEKNQAALALAEVTNINSLAKPLCESTILQDLAPPNRLPIYTAPRY